MGNLEILYALFIIADPKLWGHNRKSVHLHEIRNIAILVQQAGLLDEPPPEGSRCLFELWKQIPERPGGQSDPSTPLERLRKLLIRLCERWDSYRVIDWHKSLP